MRMRIWVSKTTVLSKKGLFQRVGMEDMVSKILKRQKYRSLREKTTPFPHTRWPWWPFNALFVLCRSHVSAATLANANLGQIRANFARTLLRSLRALWRARLANCYTVNGPCPRMDLYVTSHPSAVVYGVVVNDNLHT